MGLAVLHSSANDLTNAPDGCWPLWCASTSPRASPVPSSLLVQRRRARRVVGDGAQHPGPTRGRRVPAAAAHLGGPHPDRSRLSLLRGPLLESKRSSRTAIAVEALTASRRRPPLVDSVLSQASHVVSQASRHVGFAAAAGARSGGVRPHRVHPAQRAPACWSSSSRAAATSSRRSSTSANRSTPTDLRQAANYLNAEFSGSAAHRAREAVARADAARSGCCTTR